ncbi:hypothetical protein [Marinobacterium stanieri]|uniref:hypothetical protein n=1 Tax=Marinobacterium stanieri TaxID=49186 RepID=UPI003A90CE75
MKIAVNLKPKQQTSQTDMPVLKTDETGTLRRGLDGRCQASEKGPSVTGGCTMDLHSKKAANWQDKTCKNRDYPLKASNQPE